MQLQRLALVLFLVPALAGCSDGGGNSGSDDVAEPGAFEGVEVSDTTGAIKGLVVTEAIVPIEGVLIEISGGLNTSTDVDGAFVFNNLEPGEYFVAASKTGYQPMQTVVTVVAGDADPPTTRIALPVDVSSGPYYELLEWRAFLQCAFGVPVAERSVNPCAASGSDNVHDFTFGQDQVPDFAQAEAFWTGTQPLGNRLSMGFLDPAQLTPTNWKNAEGESPLLVPATKEEIVAALGEDANEITVRVFPGNDEPTLVVNQSYDVYVSYFYGTVPREGWSFVANGPCQPADSCS